MTTAIGFLNDQILVRGPDGRLGTDEAFVRFLLAFGRYFDRVVLISRVAPGRAASAPALSLDRPGVEVVELPFYPRIGSLLITPWRWWPAIDRALESIQQLDALWLNTGHPISMRAMTKLGDRARPQLIAALRGNYETDASMRHGSGGLMRRAATWAQTGTMRRFARQAQARDVPVLAYGRQAVARARELGMRAYDFETTLIDEATLRAPPAADPGLDVDLVTVCRLVHEKGLDRLLDAMPDIVGPDGRPATLAIVGDGPLRADLEARIDRLGLRNRVRMDGMVAHGPALLTRLRSARAFVLPSRTEGVPASVIESMSMQVPVVASAVGGLPDLCGEGRGILVDPSGDDAAFAARFGAACSALLRDAHLASDTARSAFARVHELTIERQIERAVAILRNETR